VALRTRGEMETRTFLYTDSKSGDLWSWSVRNERYKLIENERGLQELYALSLDPYDNLDLIESESAFSEVIEELRQTIEHIRQ
jgi:hypothetical protein